MQGPSIAQDKAHMGHSPPRGFVHHQQCRSPAQIHWSRVCKWKRQSFCSKGRRLYEYKVAVSYQKGVYKARTSTPSLTTACRGTPCSASGGDWDAHPWVLTQAAGHKIRHLSGCCRWCGQDVPPWKSHYQTALGHGGAWTHSFIQMGTKTESTPHPCCHCHRLAANRSLPCRVAWLVGVLCTQKDWIFGNRLTLMCVLWRQEMVQLSWGEAANLSCVVTAPAFVSCSDWSSPRSFIHWNTQHLYKIWRKRVRQTDDMDYL